METFDLIIVGGGVAGLCAALAAPADARIAVIDKGEEGAGSSPLAQGGLAAAVGAADSPDLHAADTVAAGAGLCDQDVVKDVCGEGSSVTEWLLSLGCDFDRTDAGELHLAREGGQSVARSVHWRDATGAEIVRALRGAVRGRSVTRVDRRVDGLIVNDRCVGVIADGLYVGRAVLLATGGAGGLWGRTTNAPGATGDGIALALAAGTRVGDLEFMQFHPTALAIGTGQRVLLTEALRGAGAVLVNEAGDRFVDELAPRNIVAKAILDQAQAFLDCRPVTLLDERFPTVVAAVRERGFDPFVQPLPVSPAAHYFVGGVAADTHGRTSTPGLFAAGECATTGMHGANRMAGNSLLEAVVVGRRVGAEIEEQPEVSEATPSIPSDPSLQEIDPAVADIMWRGAGPVRNGAGLGAALAQLDRLPRTPQHALCSAIVRAALDRAETRGVHIRTDFPNADPAREDRAFTIAARSGSVARAATDEGGR